MTPTPNKAQFRPRPVAIDGIPVLTEVVDGYAPTHLRMDFQKGVLDRTPSWVESGISSRSTVMQTLNQLMVKAGITELGHRGSVFATKIALTLKNGRVFSKDLKKTDDLKGETKSLANRAELAAKGLASVEDAQIIEPALDIALPAAPTGDEKTVIFTPQDHMDMQAAHARDALAEIGADDSTGATPAPVEAPASESAPVVDVELPAPLKGDEKTVILTPEDHLKMQEEHARAELDQLTGNKSDKFDNIFDDSAFDDDPVEPKKSLGQRILAGLPGAITSGAVVWGTKVGVMSALGASVSALALAPAITTAAGVGAGIFVGQSVAHLRARWNEAEAAKGQKISLKDIFKGCAKGENISREFAAYRKEINSGAFWKKALTKGTFAAGVGAALAWTPELSGLAAEQLNKTASGAAVVKGLTGSFNTVADKAASALGATKAFASKLFSFGKPTVAVPAQVAAPVAAPASAPAAAAAPAAPAPEPSATAAPPVESITLTPIDKVRGMLKDLGVSDNAANKLLNRPGVTEAQRINDVAVGLNNGVYGMPLNKDTARELFQTAKEMGNAKAALDLDVATGKVAAPVAAPEPTPAPATPYEGISDETRRAAFAQAGVPFQEAAAAPAEAAPAALPLGARPVTEADAPARIGTEAARCILEQVEKGKNAIRSLCSIFSDTMVKNDTVLMESSGVGSVPYANDADEAIDTKSFMRASRRDFRDSLFVPWMKRSAE